MSRENTVTPTRAPSRTGSSVVIKPIAVSAVAANHSNGLSST